jgi:L-glyceraldehyde 3-phosphate reductase
MLTTKYLDGIPEGSRASRESSLSPELLSEKNLDHVRALAAMAAERGQSLAQMALAWSLRDPRMTSLVIGASSVAQLEQNVDALDNLDFTAEELAEIDGHAVDSGIDLWEGARTA